MAQTAAEAPEHELDALTGGAFSAATSAERTECLTAWLQQAPEPALVQQVYRELSSKDKGAAKVLREQLDTWRAEKAREALTQSWLEQGQAILDARHFKLADALAWQRDAAAAGAPLSQAPLLPVRQELRQRVERVEDLQQQLMLHVESSALLVQRLDWLSTQSWKQALDRNETLAEEIAAWGVQEQTLRQSADWADVDVRYPPQLAQAAQKLDAVWQAFSAALSQAQLAAEEGGARLPSVVVWAEEISAARGDDAPSALPSDTARQKEAAQTVTAGVKLLEQAVASGQTKDMNSAAQSLRRALKKHGRFLDDSLEARVHAALVSAGELQGWQRWSADRAREELLARAHALLVQKKLKAPAAPARKPDELPEMPKASEATEATSQPDAPASAPAVATSAERQMPAAGAPASDDDAMAENEVAVPKVAGELPTRGQESGPALEDVQGGGQSSDTGLPPLQAGFAWRPVSSGRKLQDAIRRLRDEWKAIDQSSSPNHQLWLQFDATCTLAYGFVQEWLQQQREQEEQALEQRKKLLNDLQRWQASLAAEDGPPQWKEVFGRLRSFGHRWRKLGHVSPNAYADLHAEWKIAVKQLEDPLRQAQKQSRDTREDLIAQAVALGAQPRLDISAVQRLQAQWQEEARRVPLDRRREQKLWERFRHPIDAAFKRMDAERKTQRQQVRAHEQAVLDAAQALEQATTSGDAQAIREAMQVLDRVSHGRPPTASDGEGGVNKAADEQHAPAAGDVAAAAIPDLPAETSNSEAAADATDEAAAQDPARTAESAPEAAATPRPVVAVRGDDRPGARRGRARQQEADRGRGEHRDRRGDRRAGPRHRPGDDRPRRQDRTRQPSGQVQRARREAMDQARGALQDLAARAHGEALVQLLAAWQGRETGKLPDARAFGPAVSAADTRHWAQALEQSPASADAGAELLLRLEEAAGVPTPAAQLEARRAFKLTLLTQRDEPQPRETWQTDLAQVLHQAYDEEIARRVQKALEKLLRAR